MPCWSPCTRWPPASPPRPTRPDRQREDAIRRSEEHWAEHERQRLAGAPGIPRALAYSGIISGVMLLLLISHGRGVPTTVADDIVSGLVGVVVAGLIFATEGNLAQQLGADYPDYPARRRAGGRGLRRAGSHVHGAGRGCLFCSIVLLFGGPILLGLAFGLPFVVLRHHRRPAHAVLDEAAESLAGPPRPGARPDPGDGRHERRISRRCRGRRGRYRRRGAAGHGRRGELRVRRRARSVRRSGPSMERRQAERDAARAAMAEWDSVLQDVALRNSRIGVLRAAVAESGGAGPPIR